MNHVGAMHDKRKTRNWVYISLTSGVSLTGGSLYRTTFKVRSCSQVPGIASFPMYTTVSEKSGGLS
jgi:hypothetical protein